MNGTRWRLLTGTIIALAVTLTGQTPDPSPPVAFSVNGTVFRELSDILRKMTTGYPVGMNGGLKEGWQELDSRLEPMLSRCERA